MKNRKTISILCLSIVGCSIFPKNTEAISLSTYEQEETNYYNNTISSFQIDQTKQNVEQNEEFHIDGISNLAVNKTNQLIYIYKEPDIRSEKVGILPINGVCDIEENVVLLNDTNEFSSLIGLTEGYIPTVSKQQTISENTMDDAEEHKIQEEITKEEIKAYENYLKEMEERKDLTSLDKFLLEKSNFTYVKSGEIEGFVLTNALTTENTKEVLMSQNYAKIIKDIKYENTTDVIRKDTIVQVLEYVEDNKIAHIIEKDSKKEGYIDVLYLNTTPYYEYAISYDREIYQEADLEFETKEEFQKNMVEFALQFISNKYIWGGNSLTNGCDCSGFTQQLYRNFGIAIDRTAADQSDDGVEIAIEDIQPGDLLFYGSSGIGHVSMYIGDGKVIHASNSAAYPSGGIKISNLEYRNPCKIVRIVDDSYFEISNNESSIKSNEIIENNEKKIENKTEEKKEDIKEEITVIF